MGPGEESIVVGCVGLCLGLSGTRLHMCPLGLDGVIYVSITCVVDNTQVIHLGNCHSGVVGLVSISNWG